MRRLDVNCFAEMSVFVKVVESGGYSSAAKACEMTPSAVSKLITRLENRLGARLLNRSTRQQLLTPEGSAFFERCQVILGAVDEAEREAAASSTPQGVVRVSCNVGIGRQFLLPVIGEFFTQHPDVAVEFFFTDEVVDLIQSRIDVAIRSGPLKSSNLVARRLGQSRSVIVAAPEYLERKGIPAIPKDLTSHNCLGFTFGATDAEWTMNDATGDVVSVPVHGCARISDGDCLRELAVLGIGVARLGYCQVEKELENGKLVSVLDEFNSGGVTEIHAIYVGQGGLLPARVRAFMDFLASHIKIT